MAKFKVGDKVVFKNAEMHKRLPQWYPFVGTVGEVVDWSGTTQIGNDVMIQWPKGTTSKDDKWASDVSWLELVERDGVPYSSMSVGGLTFTAAMPIVSGPEFGPEDGLTIAPIVPKRILKSGDRTIVFWQDGTKTIVKRAEDEVDNDYAAFTAALAIKLFGSNSRLKRIIDKKLEYQKTKTEKKESPLHAEPVVDALGRIGAMAIDDLAKKATELAEAIGRRIVIDVGPVVKEDDKK